MANHDNGGHVALACARRGRIEDLVMLLQSVLEARRRVMVEVNVSADKLEGVVEVLPCMREPTIARNYAEALLSLARKAGDLAGWGRLLGDVARAVEQDVRLRRFLEAPQVDADDKKAVLERALADRAPRMFVRFLQKLVDNRRQNMIPAIATEYFNLVDEAEGRVHARVTVARPVDEAGSSEPTE